MADAHQYLRLTLTDRYFLLPSTSSLAIEQRDNLTTDHATSGYIVGYRKAGVTQWPVLSMNSVLQADPQMDWSRAVFVGNAANAVGIAVTEVLLLPRQDTEVELFNPIGPPPTSAGHIFSGAWIQDGSVVLVFEPKGLSAYLQTLAGTA